MSVWNGGQEFVIAAGEIILQQHNSASSRVFEGDIHDFKDDYIEYFQKYLQGLNPWLLTLSPLVRVCPEWTGGLNKSRYETP